MQRIRAVLFLLTLIAAILPATVQAEEAQPPELKHDTRVEADDKADVIRFFVKGQLVAILDESGLHVRKSVEYGGTITDTGHVWFDDYAAKVTEKQVEK